MVVLWREVTILVADQVARLGGREESWVKVGDLELLVEEGGEGGEEERCQVLEE